MRWSKIFSWSESPLYTRIIHNLVYNLLWFGLSLSYLFYNYGQNNNYTDSAKKIKESEANVMFMNSENCMSGVILVS